MISDGAALTHGERLDTDIVVVGAGPAGITTALEASRWGMRVVVLESGARDFDPAVQELSEAAHSDPNVHAPLRIATRRQLGGTSAIWGGRCVPYDPIDFTARDIAPGSSWPISYEQLLPYYGRACDWLLCGRPVFDARLVPTLDRPVVPGFVDGEVKATDLERWSLPTDFGKSYRKRLASDAGVRLFTNVTATEIVSDAGGTATHVCARTRDGKTVAVAARAVVVAAGGLESTRLLMDSRSGTSDGPLGGESGHLGRWYMAHLEGVIALAEFSGPPRETVYGFERDVDGTYIRRRFTFTTEHLLRHGLPNISGWITNPELADASHASAELSFTYLTLVSRLGPRFAPEAQRLSLTGTRIPGTPYGHTVPSPNARHVRNVLMHPAATARYVTRFGIRRALPFGRRPPGFFVYNGQNVYPLQYHAEHLPSHDSAVRLSDSRDALGRRKLDVDLRFSSTDISGVVRAHEHWDAYFRSTGVGKLRYLHADREAAVLERSGGGFHQVGTTRMAGAPEDGVVDENLRVFGTRNVYVASSSTFVTSGQANSTMLIVILALRLTDHLAATLPR